MAPSLVVGTNNSGKFDEIKTILEDLPVRLHSLKEFGNARTAEEPGDTYAENAIAKAQQYGAATGLWTLADDSGLEVEALGGAPGIFSARYAGEGASDQDRRVLLLSELSKMWGSTRSARFVCVVALMDQNQNLINISEGTCSGRISETPRGTAGFGYDPIFVPDGYDLTFAELAPPIKNLISHRARALLAMKDFIRRELGKLDQPLPAS
jgi:XTP/dITP diphosphohydrolase